MPDEPAVHPNNEYIDVNAAAAALAQMNLDSDASEDEVVEQVDETDEAVTSAPDEATETEEEPEGSAEEEDLIPRADLDALLEGLDEEAAERVATAYKSFQRSATKSNQQAAELRRAFEDIDPTEARQAYDFVQRLGTDPEVARSVHQELTKALEDAGYSPRAAEQEATRQIETTVEEADLDEFEDNPFVKELRDLKAWKEEQVAAQAAAAEEAEYNRQRDEAVYRIQMQESKMRQDFPDLTEDDFEAIFKVAPATGGDLFAAKDYVDALKDRIVTDYVSKKKRVKTGAASPAGGAIHSEEPVEIQTVEQGHLGALERVKHLLSAD